MAYHQGYDVIFANSRGIRSQKHRPKGINFWVDLLSKLVYVDFILGIFNLHKYIRWVAISVIFMKGFIRGVFIIQRFGTICRTYILVILN